MGKTKIRYDAKNPSSKAIKIEIEDVHVVVRINPGVRAAHSARTTDASSDDSLSESGANDAIDYSVGDSVIVEHRTSVPRRTTWQSGKVISQHEGAFEVEYEANGTRKTAKFSADGRSLRSESSAQMEFATGVQKTDTSLASWAPARRAKAYFQQKLNEAKSDFVGNIDFTLKNVHIRLEGYHTSMDESTPGANGSMTQKGEYALGMTVDTIQIKNEELEPELRRYSKQFTRKIIWLGAEDGKLSNSTGFAIYCNDTKGLGSRDQGKALPRTKANTIIDFKEYMGRCATPHCHLATMIA